MIQAGIASSLSWGCDEDGQVEYSKRLGKLGRVLQLFIDFFLPCHLRSLAAYSFIFLHLKLLKLERDYISISWNKLFSIILISPDIFEVEGFLYISIPLSKIYVWASVSNFYSVVHGTLGIYTKGPDIGHPCVNLGCPILILVNTTATFLFTMEPMMKIPRSSFIVLSLLDIHFSIGFSTSVFTFLWPGASGPSVGEGNWRQWGGRQQLWPFYTLAHFQRCQHELVASTGWYQC